MGARNTFFRPILTIKWLDLVCLQRVSRSEMHYITLKFLRSPSKSPVDLNKTVLSNHFKAALQSEFT